MAGIAIAPLAIAVAADSKLKSLEDMAAAAKSGDLNYATSGIGTVHHLAMEQLQARANIKMTHVPYRGASAMLPDLISGQVPIGVLSAAAAQGQVQAGKIRVLGLTSPDKLEGATDWRPIADWLPGFDSSPRLFLLASCRHDAGDRRQAGGRGRQGAEGSGGRAEPAQAGLHHHLPPGPRAEDGDGEGARPLDRADPEDRHRAEVGRPRAARRRLAGSVSRCARPRAGSG